MFDRLLVRRDAHAIFGCRLRHCRMRSSRRAGQMRRISLPSPGMCRRIRTGEPIFQFNGKNLTGFYTYLHDA